MMLRLSPFVREAKPSADSIPAWRSTSSSMPLPSTISPGKSLPSRSKARRLLSITVTSCPAFERAIAAIAPTRPQPTITSFMNGRPILGLAAERQPRRLELGQSRLADLRLGGRNVVRHSFETNGRPAQIDQREGCSRVPIAGLPNAPRVDQRRGRQWKPPPWLRYLFTLLGENPRQVSVAEEAPPRPEPHQELQRLELIEDVLPEVRFARAAVDEAMPADPAVFRQGGQVSPASRSEDGLGPTGGGGGLRIEPVEDGRVQHRLIVIAQHRFGAHQAKAVDHGIRVGTIADRVAQHQDSVDRRHRREDGLERLEIAVDVGKEREGRPAARLRRRRVRERR